MKLTPIIAALRSRCPRFENRVGGAAQFKAIPGPESSDYQPRMLCQPKTSRVSRNRRPTTGRI